MDAWAREHLRLELERLWSLLEAHLRRLQKGRVLPADEEPFPGGSIAPTEIEARLQLRRLARAPLELDAELVEALERTTRVAHMLVSSAPALADLPLVRLEMAFGLSELERTLLLLALGPEFEPGFARLYAFLQNHFQRQHATGALVADVLLTGSARTAVTAALDPSGALRRTGLVTLDERDPSTPMLYRALRVEPRILRFVWHGAELDPALAGPLRFDARRQEAEPYVVSPALLPVWDRARRVIDALREPREPSLWSAWRPPVLVLRGPEGVGKRRMAREIASALGQRLLIAHLPEVIASFGPPATSLLRVFREARLLDACLVLTGWEDVTVPTEEGRAPTEGVASASRALRQVLRDLPLPVIVTSTDRHGALPRLDAEPIVLDVPLPEASVAEGFWVRALPANVRGAEADPRALARAYRLTPGKIISAVALARTERALESDDPVLTGPHLGEAIKRHLQHRLGDSARVVELRHDWSDLIVSKDVHLQLEEIVERHRHRNRVLEEWGLGRRVGSEGGMPVLFDGPPGTGKTMSASIIAKSLGLDLYQVDLSRTVSKWIGETEKNLARLFDEAERARALLLFDEADSLFSKRTQVESSHDRYANLEVNFLLQRIERFSGVAILTTNFPEAMDDAFKRRLSLRVTFERPSARERAELWRSFLSTPNLPLGEVDFEELGQAYDLTGGMIKNAVLRAAYLAAARDCEIDDDLLEASARVEQKKHGMVVRDAGGPVTPPRWR